MTWRRLFPSRLTIAAVLGCVILLPLSIWGGLSAGIAIAERTVAEDRLAKLDADVRHPETGYIARVTACQVQLQGARASVDAQNVAIEELQRTAMANQAQADAAIRAARRDSQAAERRAQSALQARPAADETTCQAAFRLHQEHAQ